MKQYALYKGDTYLIGGTLYQLAQYLNVRVETIRFYKSDAYKRRFKDYAKRYIVIEVEDE